MRCSTMFVLAIKEVWLAVQAVEKYHSRLNLTSTVQFENYKKKKKISKCCHAPSLYFFSPVVCGCMVLIILPIQNYTLLTPYKMG